MAYCRTRQAAQRKNRLFYKTGKPCARGHVSKRYTKTRRCYACAKVNANKRYQQIKIQTPIWANTHIIADIYRKSEEMGEDYQVDHVIPLQGELVSGLHVPDNLQIILKAENISKQNFYEIK